MKEDVQSYLKMYLQQIQGDLGLDAISVFERTDSEGRLLGFVGEMPRETVPLGVTPLGECLQNSKVSLQKRDNQAAGKYAAIVTLPIGEKPLGAIQGASVKKDFFDPYRIRDLGNVASYLATLWERETALA